MNRTTARLLAALSVSIPLATAAIVSAVAQDPTYPAVTGVWHGEFDIAFPRTHPLFPEQSKHVTIELDIYRQEANLLWAENRWRRDGEDASNVEHVTGSFRLDDPTALVLTEIGPLPDEGSQTGMFLGTVADERIFLTYSGIGGGATFSVELRRRAD